MRRMGHARIPTRLATAVLIALVEVPMAGAQQPTTMPAGWKFVFAPYAWGAGINGTVGVSGRTADVDLSVGDIIDQVDVSVMLGLELRRGPLGFILDGFYVKLTDDAAVPVPPLTNARVEQEEGMAQPMVSYTIAPQPEGGLDLLGGVRYWHMRTTLNLFAGDAIVVNPHQVQEWVDGLVGARYRSQLGERWPVMLYGDLGAGGSRFTWQALGTLGFQFARCCGLTGGYRYLHYDYEHNGGTQDLGMGGPIIGLTFRF